MYDYNAKLSYSLSPVSTLNVLAYGARDDYRLPIKENGENASVLRWDNQVYQLSYTTQKAVWGIRLPYSIPLITTGRIWGKWAMMAKAMCIVALSR